MSEKIDFVELLANIGQTRQYLREAADTVSGELRGHYQTLLEAIDQNLEEFKSAVPAAHAMFQSKHDQLTKQHEQSTADLASLKSKIAEVERMKADGKLPQFEKAEEKPVDCQLGGLLRTELLNRFFPKSESTSSASQLAWQDWNLDGSWLKSS